MDANDFSYMMLLKMFRFELKRRNIEESKSPDVEKAEGGNWKVFDEWPERLDTRGLSRLVGFASRVESYARLRFSGMSFREIQCFKTSDSLEEG